MRFGTVTSGLSSEGGLNFEWSLQRNFTVLDMYDNPDPCEHVALFTLFVEAFYV